MANMFGVIELFRVYVDSQLLTTNQREGLQKVGVEIVDVPHLGSSMTNN